MRPVSGVGLGLRPPHLEAVAREAVPVPFWEIAPENVIGDGGRRAALTRSILARDPIVTHGLSLSVGGFDPFDDAYLKQLSAFILASGTPWHSEHLCFTAVDGATTHEGLELPAVLGFLASLGSAVAGFIPLPRPRRRPSSRGA